MLVLLTGLREKRDFLGDFEIWEEEGIMPGEGGERASACESSSTDTKPDCNWGEKATGRQQLIQFISDHKRGNSSNHRQPSTHLFIRLKPKHLMFPRRLHSFATEERVEDRAGPIT
jgi:hypothetical protein